MNLNAAQLKNLLENHFHSNLKLESYKLKTIPAIQFLTFNRFDIPFKLDRMKINRSEVKDIDDLRMMEGLIDLNFFKKANNKIRQDLFYQKIKIERGISSLLVKHHLYDMVRDLYRFLMGKK